MAVDVSDDIHWFIDQHFNRNDLPEVYEILRSAPLRTPRVARAVLYLSNGSLSLLRYYTTVCADDVRAILTHAEYVVGVSEMPMQIRDMSLPFGHERNRGFDSPEYVSKESLTSAKGPRAARVEPTTNHHPHLANRTFALGKIEYFITNKQPSSKRVRCLRKEDNVISVAELPLTFVLDQLAERIELTEPTY